VVLKLRQKTIVKNLMYANRSKMGLFCQSMSQLEMQNIWQRRRRLPAVTYNESSEHRVSDARIHNVWPSDIKIKLDMEESK